MTTTQIDEALDQVRRMRELVGDRHSFRGYSGRARLIGCVLALAGAGVLTLPFAAEKPWVHLSVWTTVAALSALTNYGMLAYTLWKEGKLWVRAEMIPVVDALPPLAVGTVVSLALLMRGQFDLLFGAWMLLYGLVHVVYRRNLPIANYAVGVWYLAAGTLCALSPRISFTDPLPMAAVFGFGELCGGMVLRHWRDHKEDE